MKTYFIKSLAIIFSIMLLYIVDYGQSDCKAADADVSEITERLNKLEDSLPQLEGLLSECETKNIPTDYENVNYAVIQRFIEYEREDAENGFADRAEYNIDYLETLCSNTETALKEYLSGDKKASDVSRYVTGNTAVSGHSIWGNTVNTAMETEKRPVFFAGYGHFEDVRSDIPNFKSFGTNIIQIEIGPHNVLRNKDGQVGISEYDLKNDICKNLEAAQNNNIAVNLLLSPHYFQDWMIELSEGMTHGNDGGFLEYNIYHPKAKELIELYLRTVIPAVKDYKSLHSICLSNEPVFYSNLDEYNLTFWHDYLKEIYTDVNELNSVYGTSYTSFDEVPMPADVEGSAHFYDWMVFNNRMFADWHSWMADIIHEIAPNIPLHSKVMNMVEDDGRHRKFLKNGTDPEMFAEFSDYMGCDASNYLYQNTDGSGNGIIAKMKWYDLLTSMKNAPVFNSEDHTLSALDEWNLRGNAHFNADLWQGAIHGRSATTLWIWQRNTTGEASDKILNRADIVSAVGKTSLDLSRLSYEISEFQNQKAETAILYSMTAWTYSKQYMDALDKAYRAAVYSGQKVRFVTEKQIKEGQLKDIKVLLVPDVKNAWETTLTGIDEFIQNGGKTIILGNDSFVNDEHNKPLPSDVRERVMQNAVVMSIETDGEYSVISPVSQDIRNKLFEIYEDINPDSVLLIDSETDEPISDVEWRYISQNGKYLVNICNYNWNESKNAYLTVNGEKLEFKTNLITNEAVKKTDIILSPFEPVLITAVEKSCTLEKLWVNGAEYETDAVSAVSDGSISVKAEVLNTKNHKTEAAIIVCVKNEDSGKTEGAAFVKKQIRAGEKAVIEATLKTPDNCKNVIVKTYVVE